MKVLQFAFLYCSLIQTHKRAFIDIAYTEIDYI